MDDAETEPKWRRRADERPDEVLDAALKMFARNGFAATKVEDIASEAGLSKGAIYRYFSSKEDIFESLVNRAIAPMAERTLELVETSNEDPEKLLRAIFSVITMRLSDPLTLALPRVVLQEAGRFPHLAETYRRQVLDKGIAAFEMIVKRGIETGHFRPVNARLAIRNVLGPMLAHFILGQIFQIDRDAPVSTEEFLESHLDILMNGLLKPQTGD
ncbi:TetR/AcrR family transcriptional regulator [Hoeflea sp. TYP-13]|uniref:TetR/AcrR family transcriptional regulator n=1 Tax=Hoeflea sp. TYP-13 TaxID=3230023 RepID=UPI0034C618AC